MGSNPTLGIFIPTCKPADARLLVADRAHRHSARPTGRIRDPSAYGLVGVLLTIARRAGNGHYDRALAIPRNKDKKSGEADGKAGHQ